MFFDVSIDGFEIYGFSEELEKDREEDEMEFYDPQRYWEEELKFWK